MQCTCQYREPPARKLSSDALKIAEPLKGGSWDVNRGGFLNHCPALRDQAAVSSPLQDKVNKKINISVTRRIGSSLCHTLETNRGPSGSQGERSKLLWLLVIRIDAKSYSETQQPSEGLSCRASPSLSISHTPWGVVIMSQHMENAPLDVFAHRINTALITSLRPAVNKYKLLL